MVEEALGSVGWREERHESVSPAGKGREWAGEAQGPREEQSLPSGEET